MNTKISSIEKAALEAELLASPAFRKAPLRALLLDHFLKKGEEFSPTFDVWEKGLKNGTYRFDETRVRERCLDLRNVLDDHFRGRRAGWICRLPNAIPRVGYRLDFIYIGGLATHSFWKAHVEGKWPVVAVHNEPIFYRDKTRSVIIRLPNR